MRSSSIQSPWLAAVAALFSATTLCCVTVVQAQTTACEFSSPIFLDDNQQVSLEHYINTEDQTFTMRLTYSQGHSWIGVGFNTLNQADHTTPTYSVIGSVLQQPQDLGASYVGEAYRYYLDSQAEDASGVSRLPDFPSHLKQSTFVQNPVNDAEQISVLQFTHDLVVRNENNLDDILFAISVPSNGNNNAGGDDTANGNDDRLQAPDGRRNLQVGNNDQTPTTFIWAVGLPENQFMGRHVLHGSFTLNDLGSVQFCGGGGGFDTDAPSEAPTTNAQSVFNDVFPPPQEENSEGGSDSGSGGNVDFNDDIFEDDFAVQENEALQDPVAHLWLYHGILMGVAWGIFAPIAIFIPLLRKLDFLEFDGRWRSIHLLSSLTVVFLSVAGFALAVMANNPVYSLETDEEKQYFTGNMHYAMGIMILVIMLMQAMMGCCIPGDEADDDDGSSWSSESGSEDGKDESAGTKDNENDDKKSQHSSPLRTMMIDNKVKNEEGELVPNRTAFKQYLPKRFTPAVQERARKRAESTTVLGTAVGNDSDHQVASLTPRKMEAKSHRLEAIEVVDVPDVDFVANMNKESDKNDELVPTKVEVEGDDVSELEDPAAEKTDEEEPEKSDFLICWIYTHRLLGMALFAMALYTCHTGIVMQSEIIANSEEEDAPTYWSKEKSLLIFWCVTVGIIAFMILFRFLYPWIQKSLRRRKEGKDGVPYENMTPKSCQTEEESNHSPIVPFPTKSRRPSSMSEC